MQNFTKDYITHYNCNQAVKTAFKNIVPIFYSFIIYLFIHLYLLSALALLGS